MTKRVVILDDELISRNKISMIISNISQLEIILSTADPYELLSFIEINHVDLLFLDMSMPIMNGLEVLNQLKILDRTTKVIVMSSFADFEYANGSMKHGVVNYLLKHELDEISVIESLKNLNILSDESNLRNIHEKNDILDYLIKENTVTPISKQFLENRMQGMVLIPISIQSKIWNKSNYKQKCCEFLENFIQDAQNEEIQIMTTITKEGFLYVVFSFAKIHSSLDISEYIQNIKNKICNAAKRLLNIDLFLMIGPLSNNKQDTLELFKNQTAISNWLFFSSINELTIFNSEQQFKNEFELEKVQMHLDLIYFYTKFFNYSRLSKEIKYIFKYIRENDISRNQAIELIAQIDFRISMAMSDYFKFPIDSEIQIDYYKQFDTLDLIEKQFLETVFDSTNNFYKKTMDGKDEIIQNSIRFIHENFTKDISLQTCSDEIGVNYSYLSRVFKKEWHSTFSKYLTEMRIELAKMYLLTKQFSVNQVAEMCGYTSYNYFFRIFKEKTGVSPNQFRDKK